MRTRPNSAGDAVAEIAKNPADLAVLPNLVDYADTCAAFSWEAAAAALDGMPGGAGLNIAHEAVDRHAAAPWRERIALRFLRKDGRVEDVSFAALATLTSRFANVLCDLGVRPGDAVFSLAGRIPELYVAALGTLKAGCVFSPLFSAFGPEPVRQRLTLGDGRVLVTTAALYERKVRPIRDDLPGLRHVLIADADDVPGTLSLADLMADASERFRTVPTNPEDTALLHFTSGTTGTPKGAMHVHQAVVAHHATGRYALDLHDTDVFWCTADPGWVTGTSYGIIAPLTHAVTSIVDEAEFDAERWYRTLEQQRVTVWYTAPTAVRMLMKAGPELPRRFDLSALRFIASVGEPLHPEGVVWGADTLGHPIHDNWWQTETGGIMIANFAALPIRPGSMGRPLPGVDAAVLRRSDATRVALGPNGDAIAEDAGIVGELALRPGWPSMFRGYLNEDERYHKAFVGGWYLTGDLATVDGDGYFWFVGRADDVIKSAGHLIGPFEVESVLLEHAAVAEAGVIGLPDPVVGEVVKAYVSLKPGFDDTEDLRLDILAHARKRLGPAVAPKSVAVRPSLPRTRSGKIMRRLLKARELGLPEGDLSTLEERA